MTLAETAKGVCQNLRFTKLESRITLRDNDYGQKYALPIAS